MDNDLKSTFVPQSHRTSADSDSDGRGKSPTLHVQTDLRAGRGLLSRIDAWFQDLTAGMTNEQQAEAADEML
jgi:hypothetical protein